MKICSKCKIEKELSEFYKKTQNKSGYTPSCKKCENLGERKRYADFKRRFEYIEIPMTLNKFVNLKMIQNNTPAPEYFLQRKIRIHYRYPIHKPYTLWPKNNL